MLKEDYIRIAIDGVLGVGPVKGFGISDLWFGVLLAPFFAFASFVFFGRAVVDPAFWSRLLVTFGCLVVISLMRAPLGKLDRAPRTVSWFSIGVTAAVFIAVGGRHEFSLATVMGFGLALAIFEFVVDNYHRKKDGALG